MRKTVIFTLTLIIILTLILTIIPILTAQTNYSKVLFTHSHTKAFCDENNLCRDYEITCDNEQVVSIIPVTEPIQFPSNWEDPRPDELKNKIC